MSQPKSIRVTLSRSPIGYERSQGLTARALGLSRLGMTVTHPDNDSVRGMVFKIRHLVKVTEVAAATEAAQEASAV
ncbi:MAG: 50S ribosomal protein L30 [Cytophagales bacterium]|nr:50S ribosomal protein L30 [Armatimonadota bacterium]